MVLDADFLTSSLRSHHLPRLERLLSLLISAGNGVTSLSLFVGWVDEEFFPLRDPSQFLITLESNTIWMADNERFSTKYQRSRKWIAPVFTSESDFRPIVLRFLVCFPSGRHQWMNDTKGWIAVWSSYSSTQESHRCCSSFKICRSMPWRKQ